MIKENIIVTKSFDFALVIIELYKQMIGQKEFVLSKHRLISNSNSQNITK